MNLSHYLRLLVALLVLFPPALASAAAGSCSIGSPVSICTDYTGSSYTGASVSSICGSSSYSSGGCSTTGAIGKCSNFSLDSSMSSYTTNAYYYSQFADMVGTLSSTCTTGGYSAWTSLPGSGGTTPISVARLFTFAEANYPSIFSGTPTAGQYLQYSYRYYPTSRNILAVDTSGEIFVLGPYTGDVLTSVGTVAVVTPTVTAWEAGSPASGGGTAGGGTTYYQSAYDTCYSGTPYSSSYCVAYANAIVAGASNSAANQAGASASGQAVGAAGGSSSSSGSSGSTTGQISGGAADYTTSISGNETGETSFTLTAAKPSHLNASEYIDLSTTTQIWAFTAAEYSVNIYLLDNTNAQLFLNHSAFNGYPITSSGSTGMNFVTVPPGRYWIGTVPGQSSLGSNYSNRVYHEVAYHSLANWVDDINIPLGTGAVNPGGWQSKGFTTGSGDYRAFIETEGMGGTFAVMTAAQYNSFQAANPNRLNGGSYAYIYACGTSSGGAALEIECEMKLPANSSFYLVYMNDQHTVMGGAGNIQFYRPR